MRPPPPTPARRWHRKCPACKGSALSRQLRSSTLVIVAYNHYHYPTRLVMKNCNVCHTFTPLSLFSRDRTKKDGYSGTCKPCATSRAVAWARAKPEKARANQKKHRERHAERIRASNRLQKAAAHAKLRKLVVAAYGGTTPACACCGESHFEFLEIDHTKGNGAEHRREIGSGSSRTLRWLRDNSFPVGFQLLCRNCNHAKYLYGQCPHQRERQPSTGS